MKATVPRLRSAHSHHRRSEPMLALDKHRSSLVPFSWPHYLICAISDLHSKLGRSRLTVSRGRRQAKSADLLGAWTTLKSFTATEDDVARRQSCVGVGPERKLPL
ncbi:uncharacterized protein [Dermacentor albipictus]|uniref:uncharacterized protein isoform X2 n=1 Tax=Dermacentor albipictus TaxID=60249 RepID=UPI0038FC3B6A